MYKYKFRNFSYCFQITLHVSLSIFISKKKLTMSMLCATASWNFLIYNFMYTDTHTHKKKKTQSEIFSHIFFLLVCARKYFKKSLIFLTHSSKSLKIKADLQWINKGKLSSDEKMTSMCTHSFHVEKWRSKLKENDNLAIWRKTKTNYHTCINKSPSALWIVSEALFPRPRKLLVLSQPRWLHFPLSSLLMNVVNYTKREGGGNVLKKKMQNRYTSVRTQIT